MTYSNDANMSLQEFVMVWNRNEDAFQPQPDGTVIINVTTMPAQKFAILLTSMFGSDYEFKVNAYDKIIAIPKANDKEIINNEPIIKPGDEMEPIPTDFEPPYENKKEERDFHKLAERLDNDFVTIEIFEDELIIKSENQKALETLANLADKLDESLLIEIYPNELKIK